MTVLERHEILECLEARVDDWRKLAAYSPERDRRYWATEKAEEARDCLRKVEALTEKMIKTERK